MSGDNFSIRLDEGQKARLRRVARKLRTSEAVLMREGLGRVLDEFDRTKQVILSPVVLRPQGEEQ